MKGPLLALSNNSSSCGSMVTHCEYMVLLQSCSINIQLLILVLLLDLLANKYENYLSNKVQKTSSENKKLFDHIILNILFPKLSLNFS